MPQNNQILKLLANFPNDLKLSESNLTETLLAAASFIEIIRLDPAKNQPVSEIWVTHDAYMLCNPSELASYFLDCCSKSCIRS